jgi:hypothetical protein
MRLNLVVGISTMSGVPESISFHVVLQPIAEKLDWHVRRDMTAEAAQRKPGRREPFEIFPNLFNSSPRNLRILV